ncbi:hypothetical protein [Peptostreptococcus faecalis]|uniref:hypothetical protein n=1 Tax=Peptostreptococcus faecalis TaxID=2045015 RepID=UPI000C7BF171|nr:hypothetical protein [Peptostreptococcus faecalis]
MIKMSKENIPDLRDYYLYIISEVKILEQMGYKLICEYPQSNGKTYYAFHNNGSHSKVLDEMKEKFYYTNELFL